MQPTHRLLAVLSVALIGSCGIARGTVAEQAPQSAQAASSTTERPVGIVDHHVHLLSPGLIADWKSLGVPFSKPDEAYLRADALLAEEPGAAPRVSRVLLVPMAHIYGNEEFRAELELSLKEEEQRVAAENDYVAKEAQRYPELAVAFCSVDLMRPYALRELVRSIERGTARGLKLHLASSHVDLREAAVQARLSELLSWVAARDLPVLLHLDPQFRGLEAEDVRTFLEQVLGPLPELEIIIAHLGGSGGFGPWTQSVLATLTAWLDAEAAAGRPRERFFVDLSAVLLESPSEGVPATTPLESRALAPALRQLGLERVLFGSDYPVFHPRSTWELLLERTDLSPTELELIRTNRAPFLRD